ncbi:hypothetical protein L3X38_040945 [Prunus dulcis]|uniref:Uncharacterized protein n=1 Tax=Prunus dulcis TaxID=3755 RepID=A0AAD4UTR9_PRUDU|nr:hypothetical protein L3X38_040945 [Prunus dulcis]
MSSGSRPCFGQPFSPPASDDDGAGTKMTRSSSSSNPSQLQPPAAAISPENGEEAASVVRTSLPSSEGRLCRNFGEKSWSLVSGPDIEVMSGISQDSP